MRRPLWTTRRIGVLVLVLALVLGLGLPVLEIARTPEFHVHVWLKEDAKAPAQSGRARHDPIIDDTDSARAPFWPRYWRYLVGRPWRGQPVCGAGAGHLLETCEFAHPEMIVERVAGKTRQTAMPREITAEAFKRYPGWFQELAEAAAPHENRPR